MRPAQPVKPTLSVIGGGMGDPALLTGAARAAIAGAMRIYAPPRLAESLRAVNPSIIPASTAEILAATAGEQRPGDGDIAVIVSGDAGFHSLSRSLVKHCAGRYEICIHSGISSLQYLCGRAGVSYDEVYALSLHGRAGSAAGAVSYHRWTFLLTGGEQSAREILSGLCRQGLGEVGVIAGENLSAPDERLLRGTAKRLLAEHFAPLTALLIENPAAVDPAARLRDEDFRRGEVPMTKEAVRLLALARLDVRPGDCVWDIGAGTGGMSVALAYAARAGLVYGVERSPKALALLRENRDRLGAHNIVIVEDEAPQGLCGLPDPDKVFLGGTGGRMREILEHLTARGRAFTLCLTAVTLESLHSATECLEALGFSQREVSCLNLACARPAASYQMMTAQNPVYIISGRYHP